MNIKSLFRGLITALLVGSVLTCINQYENLSTPDAMNWFKVALTYCTPFLVHLYATWSSQRRVFGGAGSQSSKLERYSAETKILSELGATVHDNAKRVNEASTARLGVAKNAIDAAEQVISCGAQIDTLSKDNLQRVGELTSETDRVLDEMNKLTQNLRESMCWASDLSKKISTFDENFASIYRMASTIRLLADQTKLLSINASVEAARAGEAGRGFAVVAAEVKNLSEKSESQTNEISAILNGLKQNVEEIQNDTLKFTRKLDSTLQSVSQGEDDSRNLKEQMSLILSDVTQSIDKVTNHTEQLRQQMATTSEGMHDLVEGTKAVVKGSSNNIQIGVRIGQHTENLNALAFSTRA